MNEADKLTLRASCCAVRSEFKDDHRQIFCALVEQTS
jgi:hypothetical protein